MIDDTVTPWAILAGFIAVAMAVMFLYVNAAANVLETEEAIMMTMRNAALRGYVMTPELLETQVLTTLALLGAKYQLSRPVPAALSYLIRKGHIIQYKDVLRLPADSKES